MRGPVLRRGLTAVVLLGGVGAALWSLAGDAGEVRSAAAGLSAPYVLGSVLAALASLAVSLLTWRSALGALGVPLPLRPAARIFFVGQLGKYVPGSVWPVMAQMELGAGHGLSRAAVGSAGLLSIAVGLPGALLIGLLGVPALLSTGGRGYLLVFLVLPPALLALWSPVLDAGLRRLLRLLRREGRLPPLGGRDVARTAALSAAANLLLGLHAALLALDLGAQAPGAVPAVVGAFVLATVAGLLALPVPAGAGVREAVLVLALSPVLPLGAALVLALVSRLMLTAADLAVAGASMTRTPRRTG